MSSPPPLIPSDRPPLLPLPVLFKSHKNHSIEILNLVFKYEMRYMKYFSKKPAFTQGKEIVSYLPILVLLGEGWSQSEVASDARTL